MVKRKAEAIDENGDVLTTRRSSRHKTPKSAESGLPTRPHASEQAPKSLPKHKKLSKEPDGSKEVVGAAEKPSKSKVTKVSKLPTNAPGERQYWLMKAEPESRIEKGHDISFSIDDLAAKTEPEPWDGIRNPVARNNLRAMRKNDLAFFYHSSCKIPAIVGIMEVVGEHSPDLSAQDPKAPYYDPKDVDPSKPKWSVVHVEFRRKLKEQITLKDLREYGQKGGPLEHMQMLKQSRLSVSNVKKEEWDFLMGIVEKQE